MFIYILLRVSIILFSCLVHFYDYMADQWSADVFRIPRMASEYGIQSWCNNESLASVFLPEDFDTTSKMVNHRQHHGMGE